MCMCMHVYVSVWNSVYSVDGDVSAGINVDIDDGSTFLKLEGR